MTNKPKRIAVKVGSNVLTHTDGTLDLNRMEALVNQIAVLMKEGIEVILISSGSITAGRNELKPQKKLDSVEQRQLFSAIGQVKLINHYSRLFIRHNILVGQILTNKESFATRRHYLNQKNCMTVMLANGVIPIVNENDTIAVTELMFTDNDELSGLIASMMNAQALIILSNIDGVYNGNPSESGSSVIRHIAPGQDLTAYIQTAKSNFGRGGMLTKANIARKVADEGITVYIANGKRDNILFHILSQTQDVPYTRFTPTTESVSSVKKWIAHSEGFAKGEIHVNKGASELLLTNKVMSILPIGVTRIEGEFEKDDIVRIMDCSGNHIGVGKTNYSSAQARTVIGHHEEKPIVHYDYLYIE